MLDLQEQIKEGFINISRQIRASNSPQIKASIRQPIPRRKSIERNRLKGNKYVDKDIEDDDQDTKEITSEYESDEVQYYDDETLGQEREATQE